MKIVKNFVLNQNDSKPIILDYYYSELSNKMPLIIFCHGYKGFKDWGAWDLVAEEFANNNFFFVKFNFSYNGGTAKNPIDFPDLDAFGNNNFSLELNDLDRVIEFILNEKTFSNKIDFKKVYLIGHSRGGGICAIKASEDLRIKGLITWAGVSDFKSRFNEKSEEFEKWKSKGVKYVENGRTKQLMPHYFQFYLDFKKNEKRFNIKSCVENLKIPYLIIHGDKDFSVKKEEGLNLFSWNKNNSISIIQGSNHTFETKHPWEEKYLSKELKKVIRETISFINSI